MSDDRWTNEEQAAHEAAKRLPVRQAPPLLPCRRYVDNPVTPEEIDTFLKELEKE